MLPPIFISLLFVVVTKGACVRAHVCLFTCVRVCACLPVRVHVHIHGLFEHGILLGLYIDLHMH